MAHCDPKRLHQEAVLHRPAFLAAWKCFGDERLSKRGRAIDHAPF
jgi:hypothetical protein